MRLLDEGTWNLEQNLEGESLYRRGKGFKFEPTACFFLSLSSLSLSLSSSWFPELLGDSKGRSAPRRPRPSSPEVGRRRGRRGYSIVEKSRTFKVIRSGRRRKKAILAEELN